MPAPGRTAPESSNAKIGLAVAGNVLLVFSPECVQLGRCFNSWYVKGLSFNFAGARIFF